MSRSLRVGSEERVGCGGVSKVYVDAFYSRRMAPTSLKAALEHFRRGGEDYFGITSPDAQDSVLDAASPV